MQVVGRRRAELGASVPGRAGVMRVKSLYSLEGMHTRQDIGPADFSLTIDGRPATVSELLPGFGVESRVAIVAFTPGAAFGAATTLLALVTAWYEERQRCSADFFEYPDFFYLQAADGGLADLGWLEVWPPHKLVVVPATAQDVLAAITDRAVDYLMVEDRAAGSGLVLRETLNALPRHLRAALAYGSAGEARGGDVAVSGSAASERHVIRAIKESTALPGAIRDVTLSMRRGLADGTHLIEHLRRVEIDEAVGLVCSPGDSLACAPWGLGGMPDSELEQRLVAVGANAATG